MIRITEVVRQLIVINVIMFVFFNVLFTSTAPLMALYFPTSEQFRFWQPLTHMFMHANFSHIFFNMFGLYFFGSLLESIWGSGKFLKYYLICGIGSALLQLGFWAYQGGDELMYKSMVGASGAVMGLLMGVAMVAPNLQVYLLFPPIPIKMKYLAGFYFLSDLFMGFSNTGGNVANFGHIGGAITGLLITLYWKRTNNLLR